MATDCASATDLVKVAVQLAAVVIGWLVVHCLSASRDRDKARVDIIVKVADALSNEVIDLISEAYGYHTNDRDIGIEISLKMKLQDISARTTALGQICKNGDVLKICSLAVLNFKKAITQFHFEEEHEQPLGHGCEQIQTIASTGLLLRQSLLRLKNCQFSLK